MKFFTLNSISGGQEYIQKFQEDSLNIFINFSTSSEFKEPKKINRKAKGSKNDMRTSFLLILLIF